MPTYLPLMDRLGLKLTTMEVDARSDWEGRAPPDLVRDSERVPVSDAHHSVGCVRLAYLSKPRAGVLVVLATYLCALRSSRTESDRMLNGT